MGTQAAVSVQHISAAYQQLQLVNFSPGLSTAEASARTSSARDNVKKHGGCLLRVPRRGTWYEYGWLREKLQQFGYGKQKCLELSTDEVNSKVQAEQWRDLEAQLRRPHTMCALSQLPELQQIISFTAVQAITAAGAPLDHIHAAAVATWLVDPPSHASSSDVLSAMQNSHMQQQMADVEASMSLLHHLAPHMRLALAADVAAGMLCPGQPAPRDTPEHAATLLFFINEAFSQLQAECTASSGSTFSRARRILQLSVQQEGGRNSSSMLPPFLPSASEMRTWELAPHVDLQLQVPPQLLLQHLLQLVVPQGLQQQLAAASQSAPDTHHSTNHMVRSSQIGDLSRPFSVLRPQLKQAIQLMQELSTPPPVTASAHAVRRPGQQSATSLGDGQPADLSTSPCQHAGPMQDIYTSQQPDQQHEEAKKLAEHVAAVLEKVTAARRSTTGLTPATVQEVVSLAYCMVLRFLQECAAGAGARSAQWQQAVPLQALQLLDQVQQLQAMAVVEIAHRASPAQHGGAADAASSTAAHALQCNMVEKLLGLLRQLQHYRHANTAAKPTAAAATPASSTTGPGFSACSSSSTCSSPSTCSSLKHTLPSGHSRAFGGSSTYRQLHFGGVPASAFFAAEGPLNNHLGLCQSPNGWGFWQQPPCKHNTSHTSLTNSNSRGTSTAFDKTAHSLPAQQQQQCTSSAQHAWGVLQASAAVHEVVRVTDHALWQKLCSTSTFGLTRTDCCETVQGLSFEEWLQANNVYGPQVATAYAFLRAQGAVNCPCGVSSCLLLHGEVAAAMHAERLQLLQGKGAGHAAVAWDAHMHAAGGLTGNQGAGSDSGTEAEPPGSPASCSASDSAQVPNSSCSIDSQQHLEQAECDWEQWGDEESVTASSDVPAERIDSSCGDSDADSLASLLASGRADLRKLVVPVVKRFEGFCTAATQHAVKGFMARQGAGSKAGGRILPNSSSSCSSSRSNASSTEHASSQNKCSIPATPAATAGTGTPKSSEGSSSEHLDSSMWTAGLHDWHPRCILCMEEQSKLQLQSRGVSMPDCGTCPSSTPTCFDIKCPSTHAARDIGVHNCCMDSPCSSSGRSGVCSSQCSSTVSRAPSSSSSDDSDSSGSSSNGSNSSCSSSNGDSSSSSKTSSSDSNGSNSPWPVACDDPFLWRRLLWKLLGKLSPEAQAFYATHADMCPHHEDVGLWGCIKLSLGNCMWTPQHLDFADLALSTDKRPYAERGRCIRQYSRALNSSFVKSYHPSTVLVSKQVLLALSPLHHQVVPPPEVAHFLPSSFTPAVGKALMQQLFEVPVLDGFEHQNCSLQLWHVWWHVGLRVYAAQQQQQQGGEQHQWRAAGESAANVDSQTLYFNPDARLFAVGFATRQMSGLTVAPSRAELQTANMHKRALQHVQQLQRRSLRECRCSRTLQASEDGMLWTRYPSTEERDPPKLSAAVTAALSWGDGLAMGQPQLLAAVSGPRDLLIPPAQQKLQPTDEATQFWRTAMRLYIGHCPDSQLPVPAATKGSCSSLRMHAQSSAAQEEDRRVEQLAQVQQQMRDVASGKPCTHSCTQQSDVSKLLLQSPCPAEALGDPLLWWRWQQELRGLGACDVCSRQAGMQSIVCPGCSSAVYCSQSCLRKDEVHGVMCSKLRSARLRYSASSALLSPQLSSFPVLAQVLRPDRLKQQADGPDPGDVCGVMSGLDGPCFPHGNSLVAPEIFIQALIHGKQQKASGRCVCPKCCGSLGAGHLWTQLAAGCSQHECMVHAIQ